MRARARARVRVRVISEGEDVEGQGEYPIARVRARVWRIRVRCERRGLGFERQWLLCTVQRWRCGAVRLGGYRVQGAS